MHVFDFLSLRFRDNPGGEGSLAAQQPLLRLASGRPVDALRWSVLNQDTVRGLPLTSAAYWQRSPPTRRCVRRSEQSAQRTVSCTFLT